MSPQHQGGNARRGSGRRAPLRQSQLTWPKPAQPPMRPRLGKAVEPSTAISRAYDALEKQGAGVFPRQYRNEALLKWAFTMARKCDNGHQREYTLHVQRDDYNPGFRDVLADLAYENVLMWAQKVCRVFGTPRNGAMR